VIPLLLDPRWLVLGAVVQPPPPPPPAAPGPVPWTAPAGPAPADAGPGPAARAFPEWRLAVQTEGAFGVSGETAFYNHLAGARIDRRFSPSVTFGAYVGYANLKGKQDRAHNVLTLLLLEVRPKLGESVGMPLRAGSGYLPKNGPVLRMSAGLAWLPSDGFELGVDLIAPTVWITRDDPVVSMDVAVEAAFGF
jgi:hypothetical protein